ncbi:MAG: MmcQ/YjbR family DNA-binding protein [Planctomycetota bacterium]|jgi:predicted DNA-binding protein (MmcQ/YjbR family)
MTIPDSASMSAMRACALALPHAEEGTSCVNVSFHAGGKNFLFLGKKAEHFTLRLKLAESLAAAQKLTTEKPENYRAGNGGWTLVTFQHGARIPKRRLQGWIEESYRLIAPKRLQQA